MLRNVHVYGPLASRFASMPVQLHVDDFPSMLRGLNSAAPGFFIDFRKNEEFAIALKSEEKFAFLKEEDLKWSFGDATEIHLATGEKGSVVDKAAAAIVAASVGANSVYAAAVYAIAYIAVSVALSAVIGAVSKSLASKPQTGQGPVDEQQSNIFDQAVNLEGQGHPIPLVYGRFKCGTVVVSADVSTTKQAVAIDDELTAEFGETVVRNVFDNDIDGSTLTVTGWGLVGGATIPVGSTYSGTGYTVTLTSNGTLTFVNTSLENRNKGEPLFYYNSSASSNHLTTARIRIVGWDRYLGADSTRGSTGGDSLGG